MAARMWMAPHWMRAAQTGLAISILVFANACGTRSGDNPQMESGPGRISGSLVLSAPAFELRLDSPAQQEADSVGRLEVPGYFALYADGDPGRTRDLMTQRPWIYGGTPDYQDYTELPRAVDSGRTSIPFDFTQLPLGPYRLGFFWKEGGDWDIPTILHVEQPMPLALTHSAPERGPVEYQWGDYGDAESGSTVQGKLCISGNDSDDGFSVTFRRQLERRLEYNGILNFPTWTVEAQRTNYGRVYFELQGLKPGTCYTPWFTFPGEAGNYLWQDQDSDPDQPPVFSLTVEPGQPLDGLVAYMSREGFEADDPPATNYDIRHQGIMQVFLTLAPGFDFSNDTLLLAESTAGLDGDNDRAWNYLAAVHFAGDGTGHYRIRNLKDGIYRLSLVQLGDSNSDPPLVLASYPGTVALVYPHPEPIPWETWDGDAPYAEVEWTPALL